MPDIYPISPFQEYLLTATAASCVPVFLIPQSNLDDKPGRRKTLLQHHSEVSDLVRLGLVEEVTLEFRRKVEQHTRKTGRNVRVYGLSQTGNLLFHESASRSIN